ncbi:hypothetical protein [Microbacterium lacus]|uniref:Major facilitator superfamily (MFS) profile domain-containing protein n=1 Tax=Microbacterium lacus TaxID=415217 RepID=A0ABP4RVT2_9MICO
MTTPPAAPVQKRRLDVLGLIAIVVASLALVPSLLVFLIGLIPEMNAIWWLGIILIPVLGVAGVIALVLAIIGVIVAVRRGTRFVLSIVGGVLGILLLLPIAAIFIGPST